MGENRDLKQRIEVLESIVGGLLQEVLDEKAKRQLEQERYELAVREIEMRRESERRSALDEQQRERWRQYAQTHQAKYFKSL